MTVTITRVARMQAVPCQTFGSTAMRSCQLMVCVPWELPSETRRALSDAVVLAQEEVRKHHRPDGPPQRLCHRRSGAYAQEIP